MTNRHCLPHLNPSKQDLCRTVASPSGGRDRTGRGIALYKAHYFQYGVSRAEAMVVAKAFDAVGDIADLKRRIISLHDQRRGTRRENERLRRENEQLRH